MDTGRRLFLSAFVPTAIVAGADVISFTAKPASGRQSSSRVPNHPPHQNPPQNPAQNSPPVIATPPLLPPSKEQLRQNQRDIKKDVDELFALAQELKTQAAKSDSSEVLSVQLIEKTQEIEKLAKKIRDLARD